MENDNITELIDSAASYAGTLYNGLDKIVALMREDNVKKGLTTFSDAIEGMGWLLEAISIINASDKTNMAGAFDIDPVKGFLNEMIEASENMDYVLLTDLIEYEILPAIDEWGNKLDEYMGI